MDLYSSCQRWRRLRCIHIYKVTTIVLGIPYLLFLLGFTGVREVPHEHMPRELAEQRRLSNQGTPHFATLLRNPHQDSTIMNKAGHPTHTTNDVTLVTSYINIGHFAKGGDGVRYGPNMYHTWMRIFRRIENPLVVFVETKEYYDMFQAVRKEFPANLTRIVQFSRNETWAFSLRPKIERLFRQPFYPEVQPNTVNPDYSCVMHAKYEFVGRAVADNPFNTKYFAWLDVGLFRKIALYGSIKFKIKLPPKFKFDKVAFTEVHHLRKVKQTAKAIVQRNYVSTTGSFFIGAGDVLWTLVRHYMNVTETMLRAGWMSSDEQVMYYMRQHHKEFRTHTDIQTYRPDHRFKSYYYLAYISSTVNECEYNHTCLSHQQSVN